RLTSLPCGASPPPTTSARRRSPPRRSWRRSAAARLRVPRPVPGPGRRSRPCRRRPTPPRPPVRTPQVVLLQDVTVRFPGRSSLALAGASILIPPRTVLGVTGRSGTGKSTVLRVAGGWLRPTEGRALTDGVHAADGSRAAHRPAPVPVFRHP